MTTFITREKLAVLCAIALLVSALFAISIPSSRAQEASTPTSEVVAPTDSVGADAPAVIVTEPVVSAPVPSVIEGTEPVTPTDTPSPITITDVSTSSDQPAAVVEALPVVSVVEPTLSTDQLDYAPGSLVTVFGHFFSALQNIILHLIGTNEDGSQSPEVTQPVVADTNGDFTTTFTLENIFRPFYALSATTLDGSPLAQTTFTDAALGLNLDQCQNGTLANLPTPCAGPASPKWANGNINGSNSQYREGDGLPYRMAITGLANGTWVVRVQHDFTQGGKFAIDRLTRYDLTQKSNPCFGLSCNGASPDTTVLMPGELVSPDLPNGGNLFVPPATDLNAIANSREMALWEYTTGGFDGAVQADNFVTQSGLSSGNSTREFTITVKVKDCPSGGCNLMLGWTGHIASSAATTAGGWGPGNGASFITGSPFHMRVLGVDHTNGTTGGNQDRSVQLSALVTIVTPTITTTPNPSSTTVGATLNDSATLSGGSSPTGTITFKLYSPSAPTCTGIPALTNTVSVSGNSTYNTSAGFASNAVGTWRWTASYSGDSNNVAVSSGCDAEQVTVDKAQLSIGTTVHSDSPDQTLSGNLSLGSGAHDSASVTGKVDSLPLPGVTFYFFGKGVACTNGSTTGGIVLNIVSPDGSGIAHPSTSETNLAAGTYNFMAVVGSNDNYNGATSNCEPFIVNKAQLSVTTQVHNVAHEDKTNSSVPLNSVMHDTAAVSGGVGGFTAPTPTFNLTSNYSGSCASGATVSNNGTDSGNGNPKSADSVALVAGSYAYRASVAGNDNYIGADSACEPFTVNKADTTVVTAIHKSTDETTDVQGTSVPLGSSIHDKATVGTQVDSLAIGGTVTYDYFANNSCDGTPASSETLAVGTESTQHNSLTAGDYSFLASYSGDGNYNGSTATCEKVHVNKADLSISTTIHDSTHNATTTVALGSIVHDTATMTGQVDSIVPLGAVTFQFFSNGACADTGSPVTNTGADGGAVRSADSSALAAGSYSYQATVADDTNYNGKTSACEPLTVNQSQLSLESKVHDASHVDITNGLVALGSVVHDTAKLSGGAVGGFTPPAITFKSYTNGTCSADEASVTNTGPDTGGDATRDRSTASSALAAGAYSYKAFVAGDSNYLGSDSGCEPFTVNKAQLGISTIVHNATDVDKTNQMVPLNSVMHDTATVTGGVDSFDVPATSFTLTTGYTGTCAAGDPVTPNSTEGGAVRSADSSTLGANNYAYRAVVAGDANYLGATGVCEPFRVINPHTTISITPNVTETFPGGNVILTISDTNDGDVPLTSPSVDLGYNGATTTLTKLLPLGAFTGGDTNSNDIMDPGETWTWTVTVSISVNTTFSVAGDGIDPLGSHISPANGYATEATNIAVRVIGTTRTLGFWQTHTNFTNYVYNSFINSTSTNRLYVGVNSWPTTSSHKGIITATSSPLASELFGGFYAPIPKRTDGTKRGQPDQTSITLLQQLLAAKLNCAAFGCSSAVQGQIATADTHYASRDVGGMKTDIGLLDTFNNSGDGFAIPLSLPATGKATPSLSKTLANLAFWNTP